MVMRVMDLIWSATFILSLAATALAAPATEPVAWLNCSDPLLGHALQIGESCSKPWNLYNVIEGDEAVLNIALNQVHRKGGSYIALLFYASWCPFSKLFKPNFHELSSMFPSIQHFAFDESLIRPSILSRYGVHGFPTLFLLNETTNVWYRYRGTRTITDLVAFYNDATGFGNDEIEEDYEPESFPIFWVRSPENFLQQETYLALASCFLSYLVTYFQNYMHV